MQIAWFVLVYLFAGVVFLLAYILALRPEPRSAQLGLIGLFWPAILLIDVVLALAVQFHRLAESMADRFRKG